MLIAAFVGCAGGGGQQFSAGQAAEARGNYAEAYRQFTAALAAEPKNGKYRRAKEAVGVELAKKTTAEATGYETAGQWSQAAETWDRAAQADPDTAEYKVRRDLAKARSRDLSEKEWFDAAKAVADAYPGNDYAEQTLSSARDKAYQYHISLAEDLLAAGRGREALKNIETAKAIDPDTPGLRVDVLTKAEALALTEEGDAFSENGEHIAAYEKYQAAYAKLDLPEIKTKLAASKKKAGRILALLEQARAQNKRGRYGRAVALYEKALKLGGVPDSIKEEAQQARASLVKQDAKVADRYSKKGSLRYAERALLRGVQHAKLEKEPAAAIKAGLKAARGGKPGASLDLFAQAELPDEHPLAESLENFAVASAKQVYARAKRYSRRSKPKALALLGDLEPFEDDLPQIAELRRTLRAGSFLGLLSEAKRVSAKKRDGEAASLLVAAMNASSDPEPVKSAVKTGADALKVGKFAEAEKAFRDALVAGPRSKLAQTALALTQKRRAQAEKEAVALLKSGKGNDLEATELLEAGLALDASSKTAKAGAEAIMGRLKDKALTDAEAGALIGYANRLGATPGTAKGAVADAATRFARGDLDGAAEAFSSALDAAPGNALATLGKRMADDRSVDSLKGEAAAATTGDLAAAEALAELLRKNPRDKDGQRQLGALLDKAKTFASAQNDAEAARFLNLATVAVSPSTELKAALDKGHAAFKAGEVAAAEKAYAAAKRIDANNVVARESYNIARDARLAALSGALAAVKSGGDPAPLAAQLKASLSVDPSSAEAKKAYDALLAEAEARGAAGDPARAAQLLDAANAMSPNTKVQNALREANTLLKQSKFADAERAYAKLVSDSPVAKTGRKIASASAATNLSTAVQGLTTGSDLVRGAVAARRLLKDDPNSGPALAAVNASLKRAEKAGSDGDDRKATQELKAAATALGESGQVAGALMFLSTGKYGEAEKAFNAASGSKVAKVGGRIARQRKLFSLKLGLSGSGAAGAMAIRRLLRNDPNNPEALKAFDAMLGKATAAAAAGKDGEAAETLDQASVAAASPRALERAIKEATAQLKEGRYALAEVGFREARTINADSKVVKTGLKIAASSRARYERATLKKLGQPGDPRPLATGLAASLRADPKSPAVASGVKVLLTRADRSAKAGNDTDAAQALEGAAILENKSAEQMQTVAEASAQLAKGAFEAARKTFLLANADAEGSRVSVVARSGARLARDRQLATLRADLTAAQKSKDILQQADIVQRILAIEPKDRTATRLKKRLAVSVKKARLQAARTQKSQGKLGVAHLYLVRSLALDENDKETKAELADVEAKLKKSMDLILVVEPVQRKTSLGTRACKDIDPIVREALQTEISKQSRLGAYVLSPAWTKLYEAKDARAPSVNGGLRVRIDACRADRSSGEMTVTWDILTPRRGGNVAKGSLKATLPRGLVLRDEQDAAGKNAAKQLAKRTAAKLIEKIEEAGSDIRQWLVSRAEYGMKTDDPTMVAEAYARIRQMNRRSLDPERIIPIENYLAEKFR